MTFLQKYVSVLKVYFYFINIILSASTVKKRTQAVKYKGNKIKKNLQYNVQKHKMFLFSVL